MMIPYYQGKVDVRVYTQGMETPDPFSGQVLLIRSFSLKERHVFLVLDTLKGELGQYNSEEDFKQGKKPGRFVKLAEISDVWLDRVEMDVYNTAHCFSVAMSDTVDRYFTHEKAKAKQWVAQIWGAVQWVQLYEHCQKPGASSFSRNSLLNTLPDPTAPPIERSFNEVLPPTADDCEEEDDHPLLRQTSISLIDIDAFTKVEQIGIGSFGKVFKVIKNDTQKVYAMKELSKSKLIK